MLKQVFLVVILWILWEKFIFIRYWSGVSGIGGSTVYAAPESFEKKKKKYGSFLRAPSFSFFDKFCWEILVVSVVELPHRVSLKKALHLSMLK